MPDGTKPYVFRPEYPMQEAIDLGRRVAGGAHGLAELKDACGIAGCVLEKHDGEPDVVFGAAPAKGKTADLSKMSLKALGQRLEKKAAESAPAAVGDHGDDHDGEAGNPAIWLPIILQIIQLLISRRKGK